MRSRGFEDGEAESGNCLWPKSRHGGGRSGGELSLWMHRAVVLPDAIDELGSLTEQLDQLHEPRRAAGVVRRLDALGANLGTAQADVPPDTSRRRRTNQALLADTTRFLAKENLRGQPRTAASEAASRRDPPRASPRPEAIRKPALPTSRTTRASAPSIGVPRVPAAHVQRPSSCSALRRRQDPPLHSRRRRRRS